MSAKQSAIVVPRNVTAADVDEVCRNDPETARKMKIALGLPVEPLPKPEPIHNSVEAARRFGVGSEMHGFMWEQERVRVRLDIKTTNPNNGSRGTTRGAAMAKARRRKFERGLAWRLTLNALRKRPLVRLPVKVSITRVAPSRGLDPMDGLGAALKACIDGIADALGCKDDRDPRIVWDLPFKNRRGRKGEYAVEIEIRAIVGEEKGTGR